MNKLSFINTWNSLQSMISENGNQDENNNIIALTSLGRYELRNQDIYIYDDHVIFYNVDEYAALAFSYESIIGLALL